MCSQRMPQDFPLSLPKTKKVSTKKFHGPSYNAK
jgi:hypothetical protein